MDCFKCSDVYLHFVSLFKYIYLFIFILSLFCVGFSYLCNIKIWHAFILKLCASLQTSHRVFISPPKVYHPILSQVYLTQLNLKFLTFLFLCNMTCFTCWGVSEHLGDPSVSEAFKWKSTGWLTRGNLQCFNVSLVFPSSPPWCPPLTDSCLPPSHRDKSLFFLTRFCSTICLSSLYLSSCYSLLNVFCIFC